MRADAATPAPPPSDARDLLRLAVPASLAIASEPVLNIVDTAMIGHLGVEPLAAKAIATSLIGAVSWIFAFLIFGTTSLVASQYGSRNYPACGEIFRHALALAVAGGTLAASLCFLFAPQLYSIMGATPAVAELGIPYFRIRCAAIPMLFSIYAAVGFLRGVQNTVAPMLVAFAMSATHIVLDYALIYGGFGFPALGLRGAAVAAVAAHGLGIAAYLRLLLFSDYTGPYELNSWKLRVRRFRNLSRIAGDLAVRTAGLRLSLVFATAILARMGPVYLAAYEIVFQLFIFCSDTIDGLAVAGQTLVARHLGAGHGRRALRLGRMLVGWGCAGGALFGLAYFALQEPLLRFFTDAAAVTEIVRTEAFLLLVVFQPLNGIVFALDGFLLGAHDTRFLMWAMLAGGLLLFAPLTGLAFHLELGLLGVWSGFSLFMVQRVSANLWRLFSQRWEGAFAAYHAGHGG